MFTITIKRKKSKKEVERLKELKFLLWDYFYEFPNLYKNSQINSIDLKVHKEHDELIIFLQHPGILIGLRGASITKIVKYLSNDKRKVKITLKEYSIWK